MIDHMYGQNTIKIATEVIIFIKYKKKDENDMQRIILVNIRRDMTPKYQILNEQHFKGTVSVMDVTQKFYLV